MMTSVLGERAITAGKLTRKRQKNPPRREVKKSLVRNRIYATAPSVVDLSLQAVADTLHGCELKAVVVTVLASGELRHCAEPRIGRLQIREWRKTALTYRLITVHLRQVGLVHGTRADVLRLQTRGRPKLMLDSQTPFHEVWRVEFAVRDGRNRDRRETSCGICQRRGARKLARRKACSKLLICCHRRVNCAVVSTAAKNWSTLAVNCGPVGWLRSVVAS